MNSEEAFLRAIHEKIDDDNLRLIYADWLEERGDERAEYLRLEVQLRTIPKRLAELREKLDPAWLAAVNPKWKVVLMSVHPHAKINAIKLTREFTGIGLKEAKDLVEAAPATIKDNLTRKEARKICEAFRRYGEVVIEPHG